jgi:hypothetical protein
MRCLIFLLVTAFLASCTSPSGPPKILRYSALGQAVDKEVVVRGYWSAQHEATGIYFGRREYRAAPYQCVMTDPALKVHHQSRVLVSGTLERSGCGDDLICLTTCQPYVLRNARLVD